MLLVFTGDELSVTLIVKLNVPAVVGIPDIVFVVDVDVPSTTPGGVDPVTDHEIGVVPPVIVMTWE